MIQATILGNHGKGKRPDWPVKEVECMVANLFFGQVWQKPGGQFGELWKGKLTRFYCILNEYAFFKLYTGQMHKPTKITCDPTPFLSSQSVGIAFLCWKLCNPMTGNNSGGDLARVNQMYYVYYDLSPSSLPNNAGNDHQKP
jgi:hypothetical protein